MMYWIYDIPSLTFGLLAATAFFVFGIGGVILKWVAVRKRPAHVMADNEVVGYYFSAIVGFYGITLGLISVGAWQTFADAEAKSTQEAAAIEALFRDFSGYPQPQRGQLQAELIAYTEHVINEAWPAQKLGLPPPGKGTERMNRIQSVLYPFDPQTQSQIAIHREAIGQFNKLAEMRRLRVLSASGGLPATMWWVIIIGAAASVALTWLFRVESLGRHLLLTGMYSVLLGLLVFLIASLDNPYRGQFGVDSSAFELVLDRMKKIAGS